MREGENTAADRKKGRLIYFPYFSLLLLLFTSIRASKMLLRRTKDIKTREGVGGRRKEDEQKNPPPPPSFSQSFHHLRSRIRKRKKERERNINRAKG